MRFHTFPRYSKDTYTWPGVVPGDIVHSPGACGWSIKNLWNRTAENMYTMGHKLMLVLSIVEGPPDDTEETGIRTFYVLSRHGVLVFLQNHEEQQ